MLIKHTEQTKIRELARPNTPKDGFCPDQTDQNVAISQTKQTKSGY